LAKVVGGGVIGGGSGIIEELLLEQLKINNTMVIKQATNRSIQKKRFYKF
jgi:hypothetical protein